MDNNPSHIIETREYDNFRFMDTNREPVRAHIENIKKSIEENGNFTAYAPILVNENFEIVDGQHRFIACKELGIPVFYTVAPNTSVREARRMNILNKNWQTADYAHSYSTEGRVAYQLYNVLRDEYPEFGHSTILAYMIPGRYEGVHANFRDGNIEFGPQDVPATRERLDMLRLFADICPSFTAKTMARALLAASKVEGFDVARLLSKVDEHKADIFTYQSYTDNLRALESLYNSGRSSGNRLRFF